MGLPPIPWCRFLGSNLNLSTIGYRPPYLIHFLISYGDTAVRPISEPVSGSDGAIAVRQSVDIHVAPGRETALLRPFEVPWTGIGDVDRLVELAVRIARVENVGAFRRFVI